jgi:taurine dioxygenase
MDTQTKLSPELTITRLAGSLGAAIAGLDLAQPASAELIQTLRQAFLEHLVLVFPGQAHLTPAQHVAFARHWGTLQTMPAGHLPGHPELIEIAARRGVKPSNANPERRAHETAKLARTDIWHSDQTYEPHPVIGSLLLARELPGAGGDTMFANQYDAFETLSAGMQALLRNLRAMHSGEGYYRLMGLDPADAPVTAQPVARVHAETGRTALYVNRVWTRQFEGMTIEESQPLLNYLYAHAVEPGFTFRHRWQLGDLVIWDNRAVQHYAIDDYGMETRIMHRATILGTP